MQPEASIRLGELLHLRPYVEGFLDQDWLQRQLDDYESWAKTESDPVLQARLLHRPAGVNVLVAKIWAARWWEREVTTDPSFEAPGGAKRLVPVAVGLAITELIAGLSMDADARDHLRERLQDTHGFWGLAHELQTVAYLARKPVTIAPFFLRKASEDEIVVEWHGERVPVQCKAKLPGAGRAISQDLFTSLAASIAQDAKRARQRLLVRIGSAGPIHPGHFGLLRNAVRQAAPATFAPILVTDGARTFSIQVKPLTDQIAVDQIDRFTEGLGGHLKMIVGSPTDDPATQEADVVVVVDAEPQEHAWRSLRRSIDNGAGQLDVSSPGLVAIHYADPMTKFEGLAPAGEPLGWAVLRKIARTPSVAGVMLSAEPDLQLPGAGDPGPVESFFLRDRLPDGFPEEVLGRVAN
jgi:hypothetical protein